MIEVIIFTLIGYPIFCVGAHNVFGIQFTRKILPYVIVIGGTCAIQFFVHPAWGDPIIDLIIFCCDMLGMLLLAEKDRWKAFFLFPVIYFMAMVMNLLMSYGEAAILGIEQNDVRMSFALTLLIEPFALLVYLIVGFVVRKMNIKGIELSFGQYIFQIVAMICIFLQVGIMQGFAEGDALVWQYKQWFVIATIVSSILFFGLTILQQIIQAQKFTLERDNDNYRKFLEQQERYVSLVVRADEKKRKMHHDLRAHMTALSYLSEKGDLESIKTYLKEMEHDIKQFQVEKFTNIYAVDAIISEWHQRITQMNIEWQWLGELANTEKFTVYDLCVIFSNVLSNAYEAAVKCTENGYVHVKCTVIGEEVVVDIVNSCIDQIVSNEKPSTSKKDKSSHGFGLQNVEDVVKKYNGTIEYDRKKESFRISIVM